MAEATPIQTISMQGVQVWVKREDLNHLIVQGNKLHKLKHNLIAARRQQAKTLVTFGGAYSNHLLATAYAAQKSGFKSVGIVRGDELKHAEAHWSETLQHCRQFGMQLEFVSRADYRFKQQSETVQGLINDLDSTFIIPEGGSNLAAIQGVAEWLVAMDKQLKAKPTHVFCPVGTGGTLAGMIAGCAQIPWQCEIIGISVLKGLHSVKNDINQWLSTYNQDLKLPSWQINHQFHGGGYAKSTADMLNFGKQFKVSNNVPLDKIYNLKSFYALDTLIQQAVIEPGDRPLIIHTGGLQGGIA